MLRLLQPERHRPAAGSVADPMSRQAQAERENQARVILDSAEAAIASNFVEAARVYEQRPGALQLQAMNIIYETTKERRATIHTRTSMVDSLNPALALAIAGSYVTGTPIRPLPESQRNTALRRNARLAAGE